MHADAQLLATIAGGIMAAFIGGYLARRLGLPPIVGYLVAGMAVGPFTPGFIADQDVATELAEIGVILLMFGVGLHFSFRDLWSVRAIAVPGAIGQIAVATALGTLLGVVVGWGIGAGIVLGLAVSVASTVVLLRALGERRELDTAQGRIAVGWLIIEDLFTVVVLVLLPTVALFVNAGTAPAAALGDLVVALGKAVALVVVMAVVGARVLPWLLLSVARDGSRELFTLAVLSASIGIAFVSYAVFGVSLALGAFLAGAILAESDLSHQAASDALPLRDAFAVLFFVSVGMLVDPSFLLAHPLEVVAVVGLIVVGKSLAALAIVIAFAYPARVALTVAAGLAQVGEFTFILAALGMSLGVLPAEAFQLTVAGAIFSIALNPFVFAVSDRLEPALRRSPLVGWFRGRWARELGDLDGPLPKRAGRRHAIIVGFGRVGALVAGALDRRGFGYVVIDQDRRLVEHLRERGVTALFGDAGDPELLERAGITHAAVLVLAVSDPAASAVVYDRARQSAPRLDIVVRTHAEKTATRLRGEARAWPIVGERELAVQIARVALRRFGVSGSEVEAIANGLRSGPGGGTGRGTDRPSAPFRPRGWPIGVLVERWRSRRTVGSAERSRPNEAPGRTDAQPSTIDPSPSPSRPV
jgi:CPA2 family monovalent cation:H+ antiporter-2